MFNQEASFNTTLVELPFFLNRGEFLQRFRRDDIIIQTASDLGKWHYNPDDDDTLGKIMSL